MMTLEKLIELVYNGDEQISFIQYNDEYYYVDYISYQYENDKKCFMSVIPTSEICTGRDEFDIILFKDLVKDENLKVFVAKQVL